MMPRLVFVSPAHLSDSGGQEPLLFYSLVSAEPGPAQYNASAE